jgi:hypothetical protein
MGIVEVVTWTSPQRYRRLTPQKRSIDAAVRAPGEHDAVLALLEQRLPWDIAAQRQRRDPA